MANDDMGVGRSGSPPVTPSGTEGVGNVNAGTASAPPPVDAPTTPVSTTVGLNGSGGPVLPSPRRMNPADLMTLLYALQKKTKEGHIEDAETSIKMRADDKHNKNADLLSKLKKIAHSKPNKAGGICAKVFAWVGVALAFVVAAVVAVVSGGLAAAPLFALAALSMGLLIAQETGGMDKMTSAMGMDDKQKMIFSISLTVALLVLNIGATVATGGVSAVTSIASGVTSLLADTGEAAAEGAAAAAETAASASEAAAAASETAATASEAAAAASEGAATTAEGAATTAEGAEAGEGAAQASEEATSTAAKEGAESAQQAGKNASKSTQFIKNATRLRAATQIVSGTTMVAGGSIGIDTARKEYDGTMARSYAMRDKAELAKLAAMDEDDMRRIKKLIEQLQNATVMVLDTLSSADETATKIRTSV